MRQPRTRLLSAEWPLGDQTLWNRATQRAELFDEDGQAAHWSATSKGNAEKAYGFWAAFLSRFGRLDPDDHAAARASQENLQAYLQTLQELNATSIANRFRDLYEALRVMCPNANQELLRQLVRRLQAVARRQERVRPNIVSTTKLYEAGIARMKRVSRTEYEKIDVRAVQFGDGLLLAMQACKALRRRNIVNTRIGVNLVRIGEVYVLQFTPRETKNGQSIRAELPRGLTPFVDRWLNEYRPTLLRDRVSDALWISCYRKPMDDATICWRFNRATEEELGVRLSPHHVRHCLATSVAVGLPQKVRILPFLLDHKGDATSRKYYVLADKLAASDAYLSMLERRRRKIKTG
jgi:integrase